MNYKSKNSKKNAVVVAAGKNSLHRQLLKGNADYDLHLLIYDNSYEIYCNDTKYIDCQSGYKMDMFYRYVHSHPTYLDKYDYFFLMDDDVEMDTKDVNELFRLMRKYELKIAQPSLVMSYYTYEHTLRNPLCILRYTNFVEMMMPCFSKEALLEVLPTFEHQVRGCGIEFHWPLLINDNHKNMAVIDAVSAKHTRRLERWTSKDEFSMQQYVCQYNLSTKIKEYSYIGKDIRKLDKGIGLMDKENLDTLRSKLERSLDDLLLLLDDKLFISEILPLSFLCFLLCKITEKKRYADIASLLLEKQVCNAYNVELNSQLYKKLFDVYAFKKGRRFVLRFIGGCLQKIPFSIEGLSMLKIIGLLNL